MSNLVIERSSSQVRAKLFVCSSERTGSTFLCRALTRIGVGVPLEYFNPHRFASIASCYKIDGLARGRQFVANSSARQAYMNVLLDHRTVNGIFASKIQWGQYASFLDNSDGDRLLTGGHFIHLYREDLLAQSISRHIAVETGRWGLDAMVTSTAPAKPRFFDADLIAGYLTTLATAEMKWRKFFAMHGIQALSLSYERLTAAPAYALRTIVETFGLELPTIDYEYVDAGPTAARDAQVPPRAEIRAHFLRTHRRMVRDLRAV